MPSIQVNNNYFSIQNANMAYIMGFLAADGNISKKGNRIQSQLSIKDKNHLEMIQKEIGGCEVYEYSSNGYKSCGWHCYSAQIKNDLAKYGIIPHKTGTLKMPIVLDKQYWKDFIRGYFDGDGSISATAQGLRWQICSATDNVLQTIVDFFYKEYDIPKVKIQSQQRSQNTLYTIQYSTNATKKIFNILYTPNSLYLKRKYNKFVSIMK